nr:mismatch repair and meiotic recombination protein [Moesziomyces parantarcticus]
MLEWRHPVSGRLFHIDLRTGHSIAIGVHRRSGANRTTIVNRSSLNKGFSIEPVRRSVGAIEVSDDEFIDAELDAIIASIPLPALPHRFACSGGDVGVGVQGPVLGAITRSALERARVLDQIDGKYIVCTTVVDAQSVVFCVDQHAADERYRLERLLEEYHARCADATAAVPLQVELTVDMDKDQYEVLKTSRSVEREMKRLGWEMQLVASKAQVDISSVPYVLKDRTLTEKGRPKNHAVISDLFAKCLEEIVHEMDLKSRRGHMHDKHRWQGEQKDTENTRSATQDDSISFARQMPGSLLEVVKSKACRSAIMFNDTVARDVCEWIVARLAMCKFPFQCAHGRPTLVPLCQIVAQPRNEEV